MQSFGYYYEPFYDLAYSSIASSDTNYQGIVKMSYLYVDGVSDVLFAATENLYTTAHLPSYFAHFVKMTGPSGIPSGSASDRCVVMGVPYQNFNTYTKHGFVLALQAKSADVVYAMLFEDFYPNMNEMDRINFFTLDFVNKAKQLT